MKMNDSLLGLGLGIQYLLYSVDVTIYLEACRRFVRDLRDR